MSDNPTAHEQPAARQSASPNRPTTITTALIVVLIVQLGAMSWYTYSSVQEQLAPSELVAQTEAAIENNYPQLREEVNAYLDENAPQLAEQISQQAIDYTPKIRQWLEEMTARQMRYGLDEATEMSAESFREFVQANRADVEAAFEQIEQAPQEARQLVLNMEDQLDETFGVELQAQAEAALKIHRRFNEKLDKLSTGARLEPKELLERRIVRLLRTFQEEKLPDASELDLPTISSVEQIVE